MAPEKRVEAGNEPSPKVEPGVPGAPVSIAAALERLAAAHKSVPVRRTDRLILRPWREDDRAPFAAMNADPAVMEHFPAPLTRAESDALIDRSRLEAARRGFGLQAVQDRATNELIGMVGLWVPEWDAEFTPAVEIAWRLRRASWGQGLAYEAARDVLAYAFDGLRLPQVSSWTVPANERSWRLMERLGMQRIGMFQHPKLAEGHPLREHVRYGIDAPAVAPSVAPSAGADGAGGSGATLRPPHAGGAAADFPPEPGPVLPKVWIDGDGCPRVIKEIVWKAAHRGAVNVTMVANRDIVVPRSPRIRLVGVSQGMDVADDWLVVHAGPGDLVITADVPLAAELVPRGVNVLTPRGEWFTPANIGEKLSIRDYFTEARASGMIDGGGPGPFDERAKRMFASGFDKWIASKR